MLMIIMAVAITVGALLFWAAPRYECPLCGFRALHSDPCLRCWTPSYHSLKGVKVTGWFRSEVWWGDTKMFLKFTLLLTLVVPTALVVIFALIIIYTTGLVFLLSHGGVLSSFVCILWFFSGPILGIFGVFAIIDGDRKISVWFDRETRGFFAEFT